MLTQFLQILNHLGFQLICFCIPGLLLTIGGIRIIFRKSAISVGRGRGFRWKEPVELKGKEAILSGGCLAMFGIGLLLIGIIIIFGVLQ